MWINEEDSASWSWAELFGSLLCSCILHYSDFSFSSQDTCVALQALAEYAILSYVGGVNLTISLASTNLDYQETFELNKMNKKVLQTAVVGASVQADF